MKLSHVLFLSVSLFSFQAYAMDPYEIVEHIYNQTITYSPSIFSYSKDGSTLSTSPCLPKKNRNQQAMLYNKNPKEFKEAALYKETSLYKVIPGQDGRKRIENTATWPHCINTKLKMISNGNAWGGSGTMIGPHHVLTCAHCVYDFDEKSWFKEILACPALNGKIAPFGEVKVTRAYIFKSWLTIGDSNFDIALLLLDQSIGDYTGWGGLLSAPDTDLSQEEVYIIGYPGDKGFKQMWGMGHKIKEMTSDKVYYEHDTQGGQSGSAIWINKYGMPLILGVHTLGCGYKQDFIDSLPRTTQFYSSLVNSGVRLSERKFTDLLLKNISNNYILNNSSLANDPFVTPIRQPFSSIFNYIYNKLPSLPEIIATPTIQPLHTSINRTEKEKKLQPKFQVWGEGAPDTTTAARSLKNNSKKRKDEKQQSCFWKGTSYLINVFSNGVFFVGTGFYNGAFYLVNSLFEKKMEREWGGVVVANPLYTGPDVSDKKELEGEKNLVKKNTGWVLKNGEWGKQQG